MHVVIHDAFGTTMAEGDLDINDAPGSEPGTSTRELLRIHLDKRRTTLNCQHIPPALAWSVTVTDV